MFAILVTKRIALCTSLTLCLAALESTDVAASTYVTGAADERVTLASFEGGQITLADLRRAIDSKDPLSRTRLSSRQGKLELLRELENFQLLILEARRRGYDQSPSVEAAVRRAAADTLLAEIGKPHPGAVSQDDVKETFDDLVARKIVPPGTPLSPKAEAKMRRRLAEERADEVREAFLKRLVEEARPEIHPELLDGVQRPAFATTDQPSGFPTAPRDPRGPATLTESDPF